MKKWLTAILLSLLVISALPVTATAEEVTDEIVVEEIPTVEASSGTYGSVSWELSDDGTLTISGTGTITSQLRMKYTPSQVKKIIVKEGITAIGEEGLAYHRNVTSVVLPEGLTVIGKNGFLECNALAEIRFPKSLTKICARAFWRCGELKKVTIPSGVTEIEGAAFEACKTACFLGDKPVFRTYGEIPYRYGPFINTTIYYDPDTEGWDQPNNKITYVACRHSFRDVTCSSTGKCERCGALGEDYDPHVFTNYISDSNAACIKDGTQTAVCENCTATKTIPEPDTALGHNYAEATCTEASKCTRCGVKQGYSLGHDYGEYTSNNDATCTQNGTETAVCSRCQEEYTKTVYGSKLPHDYASWNHSDATCTEDAQEFLWCRNCGDTDIRPIPDTALGHLFETYRSNQDGTCTEDGTESAQCEREYCTAVDTRTEEDSALGHYYPYATSNGDATCTADGTKRGYCKRCDNYDPSIPDPGSMLPHAFPEISCTEDQICPDCGAAGEKALGHSYVNYVDNEDVTCTQNGTETAKCDRCESTDTQEVADSALGHNLSDKWSMTEDHHWHTCLRCGSEEEKQPHDFSSKEICPVCNYERSHIHDHNPVAAKPSSCTEDGCIAHYICSGCDQRFLFRDGYKEVEASEVILPAAHAYSKATCLTGQTCEVCGAAGSGPLGHNYYNDICTRCGHERNPEKPITKGVERIFGSGRAETARKVADKLKGQLGVEKFDAILYTSGMNFADALAGSYLSAVKSAPILLYLENSTDPQANLEYIQNNLSETGTVYILGGAAAVPEKVNDQLAELGIQFRRVAGNNRYLTNLEILKEAGFTGGKVLVCTSMNFADSLSASATGLPILLVGKDWTELSKDYQSYLAAFPELEFVIIGGGAAVHEGLEQNLMDTYGNAMRLAGNTRFETSALVATAFFDAPDSAVVAYAMNFPDGLCGGALAYAMNAPLILTASNATTAARDYIRSENIAAGAVLGGKTLISDEAVIDIFGK